MEAEGVMQDPGHLSAFTEQARECSHHYCSDRSNFLADYYVSHLPAEPGKEGLEQETGEPFGSHRRDFYECQVHFPFTMQTLFSCFFSPGMEYSDPVSQSQLPLLSEGSWQGQLQASGHPGFSQPCGGRVTHYKYGCWFNEGVLEKERVIINRENAPTGISQAYMWIAIAANILY